MKVSYSNKQRIVKASIALCAWAAGIAGSCGAEEPTRITGKFKIICPVVSRAEVSPGVAGWVIQKDKAPPSLQTVGKPDSAIEILEPLLKEIIDSVYGEERRKHGDRDIVLRSYLNSVRKSLMQRYSGASSRGLWDREFTERIPLETGVKKIAEIEWIPSLPLISSWEVIVVTKAAAQSTAPELITRQIRGRSLTEHFRVEEFRQALDVTVVETRFGNKDVFRFWRWESGRALGALPNGSDFQRAADSLSLELSSVAIRVLRILKNNKLGIGGIVDEESRRSAEAEITALFPRLMPAEADPKKNAGASVVFDGKTGRLTVTVGRIPMIEEVRIREQVKREAPTSQGQPPSSTKDELVERLTRNYLGSPGRSKSGQLYTSPSRVPIAEYVAKDVRHLAQDSGVGSVEFAPGEDPESIDFYVTPRARLFPKIRFTLAARV